MLRAGNHFIAYLDDGKYSGNDPSPQRIERGKKIAKKVLGDELFHQKDPHFYVNRDNYFDWADFYPIIEWKK